MGSGAVGKSSITCQWIRGEFRDEYDPTIMDSYEKVVKVDDIPIILEVLDTAGELYNYSN